MEKNKELFLNLPVAIGGTVWDKDFPDEQFTVIGYRIGRIMGEDEDDYDDGDEEYEDEEFRIEYAGAGREMSSPVSEIGRSVFLTREEYQEFLD